MKRIILEQSKEEFYTSHSGLALVGACINRHSELGRVARGSDQIAEIDILRSYLGLLCLGKSDYQAITAKREDPYFKHALGIGTIPSAERLRQRLDEAGAGLIPVIVKCSQTMLKRGKVKVSGYKNGYVPLDVDVFPHNNSNKEGVSRTYKNYDGYAPLAAYLGLEGWCLEVELRPGSQHGQKGFVAFIQRMIAHAATLTQRRILVRTDAAHDAVETLVALQEAKNVCSIFKWNPQKIDPFAWRDRVFAEGNVVESLVGNNMGTLIVHETKNVDASSYTFKRIVRVTERTIDKHGQFLLVPEDLSGGPVDRP